MLAVLAIKDRAVNSYSRPMFYPSIGAGIRDFTDEVNREPADNAPIARHPDDYDLYELGQYDEITGKFHQLDEPKQIALGKQVQINRS